MPLTPIRLELEASYAHYRRDDTYGGAVNALPGRVLVWLCPHEHADADQAETCAAAQLDHWATGPTVITLSPM